MNIVLIGGVILLISLFGGWLLAGRKNVDEKQVKILFFMVYFWLLFFVQIAVLALAYYFGKQYGLVVIKT